MSVHSAKSFQLDEHIPAEALSTLAESRVNGNALWSIQTNHTGVHFTLFWPTEISDEDHEEIDKLSGEEKRLITQSPALLSFILKRKKLENCSKPMEDDLDECCSHKLSVGSKRSRPCSPENFETESDQCCSTDKMTQPSKIQKLDTSASDSGLSSPNDSSKKMAMAAKCEIMIKDDPEDKVSHLSEEIIANGDDENAPETDQSGVFFNSSFPNFSQAGPDLQHLLNQAGQKSNEFLPNPILSGIQGQIIHAAIQRRKQVEEEQKRLLQNQVHSASMNPAFRATAPMGNLGLMPFPNQQNNFGGMGPGLDACRALINQQQRLPPPTSNAQLTPSQILISQLPDMGLPREGEAVFRDKYIWSESVKKYLCSVCGYSTPYRSNIIVHLPKHYPELRRFRCPICNKRYGRKDLWKSHLRSRHPEVADFVLTPSWHKLSAGKQTEALPPAK